MKRFTRIAILLTLLIGCSFLVADVQAQRPTINSVFTSTPPIIDGQFSPSDTWSTPQLVLTPPDFPIYTFVYFMHDASNLYVLVDATDDNTDDESDECLLVFNFTDKIETHIIGNSSYTQSFPFYAAIGFTGSPNNSSAHKIYEFSIPLGYINATSGLLVDFCSPFWKGYASMPFDFSTYRDNVWPFLGFNVSDINDWGIVTIPLPTVGGEIMSASNFTLLAPWIALTVAIAIGVAILSRRRSFLH